MGRGHDEHEFVVEDGSSFEALIGLGTWADGEIDMSRCQFVEGFLAVGNGNADPGVGIASSDFEEAGREEAVAERCGCGDTQVDLSPASQGLEALISRLHFCGDFFGVMEELFAGEGEENSAAGAVEEAAAETSFQVTDAMTDGGLRDSKLAGGLGEASGSGKRGKGLELACVEEWLGGAGRGGVPEFLGAWDLGFPGIGFAMLFDRIEIGDLQGFDWGVR